MKVFFIRLRNIFKRIFFDLKIQDVSGGYSELKRVNADLFANAGLIQDINESLVKSIIDNNFEANFTKIIVEFKEKYSLTVNEFYIILFKLGTVVQSYTQYPHQLLEAGLSFSDYYTEDTMSRMQEMLKKQLISNDSKIKADYAALMQREEDKRIKDGKELDPDVLIDNWLAKNKK